MKAAAIISLLIGLVGLAILTYLYLQTPPEQEAPGGLQSIGLSYAMSDNTRMILFILETVGAVSGFLAYKYRKIKTGLLGMGLCMLNLILLYF
ncbi:hypothetical protein [Pontibacter chinhatensis]|uniref:Uncharacterized protein n=1 Tax=Pontibacter chinhatensis TaxID=1436961 RepID=A0A1I2YRD0_9BACT|nr:hypothetical protein [Pontibacter chinhatensis]SFH28118.1 hypothetical protein SAMN05421739_10984 [Pontibacter chinhatensis]